MTSTNVRRRSFERSAATGVPAGTVGAGVVAAGGVVAGVATGGVVAGVAVAGVVAVGDPAGGGVAGAAGRGWGNVGLVTTVGMGTPVAGGDAAGVVAGVWLRLVPGNDNKTATTVGHAQRGIRCMFQSSCFERTLAGFQQQ